VVPGIAWAVATGAVAGAFAGFFCAPAGAVAVFEEFVVGAVFNSLIMLFGFD